MRKGIVITLRTSWSTPSHTRCTCSGPSVQRSERRFNKSTSTDQRTRTGVAKLFQFAGKTGWMGETDGIYRQGGREEKTVKKLECSRLSAIQKHSDDI